MGQFEGAVVVHRPVAMRIERCPLVWPIKTLFTGEGSGISDEGQWLALIRAAGQGVSVSLPPLVMHGAPLTAVGELLAPIDDADRWRARLSEMAPVMAIAALSYDR